MIDNLKGSHVELGQVLNLLFQYLYSPSSIAIPALLLLQGCLPLHGTEDSSSFIESALTERRTDKVM